MQPWLSIPVDYRRPFNDDQYRLYWCRHSRFGYLYPRPPREMVEGFYRVPDYYTHVDDQEPKNATGQCTWHDKARMHLAWRLDRGHDMSPEKLESLLDRNRSSICDIGCGSAQLLAEMQHRGHIVIGVEPDPEARKRAKERGVEVLDGTAESIPSALRTRAFHAVVLHHVLEHCIDPLVAVRNTTQLLADGGFVIIEVPNNEALGLRRSAAAWRWLDVPRHLNFFTTTSLQLLCRKAGLEVVSTEYRGFCRQFSAEWLKEEQKIWDVFAQKVNARQLPRRNSRLHNWGLLFRSGWNRKRCKYDSVRIVAARGGERD